MKSTMTPLEKQYTCLASALRARQKLSLYNHQIFSLIQSSDIKSLPVSSTHIGAAPVIALSVLNT